MKGYDSSSQTVFLPRQFVFSSGNRHPNGHSFSSSSPVLRAASAGPSAVRPEGLLDLRDSLPDTNVVLRDALGDGERAAARQWQDKAVLTDGPPASFQPGPDTIVARSSVLDSGSVRSQNDSDAKKRLVKGAVWMRPGVKEAIECLADQTGLSFSATAAKGLEIYARAKIRDQQDTLFEPRMQAMMRREIRASDKRHLYFEMCNAIASEQTRVYTADLYKRVLRKEGFSQKEINKKLDEAYTMARDNILRKAKTPQLKNLFDAWWRTTEDLPDDTGGAGKPED
jgi:hypothetical protein